MQKCNISRCEFCRISKRLAQDDSSHTLCPQAVAVWVVVLYAKASPATNSMLLVAIHMRSHTLCIAATAADDWNLLLRPGSAGAAADTLQPEVRVQIPHCSSNHTNCLPATVNTATAHNLCIETLSVNR